MAKGDTSSQKSEQERVEALADYMFKKQLPVEEQVIRFVYKDLKPYIQGPEVLELGAGTGQMTRWLVQDFAHVTAMDGAASKLANIQDAPNLVTIHALFDEFETDRLFNTITMASILEYVEQPVALLERAKYWLAPGGRILASVPNAHSIHRLAGIKMGLLKDPRDLTQDGYLRVYTPETLRKDVESAILRITKMGGTFFKPLSYQQIQEQWTPEMIQGFYELGKDFPENTAEIFAVCVLP